jgi:hypothetical protein
MSVEAFVGATVSLELATGSKLVGTVFTYDQANCALVLLQNPGQDRPNLKLINTCFIRQISVLEKEPKDANNKLPRGIAAEATLPALAGNDSLQKRMNKALQKAEDRRQYDGSGEVPLSIAACVLFDKLTLSCGQAAFSVEPAHINLAQAIAKRQNVEVGDPQVVIIVNDVIVTDNGGVGNVSWESPLVGESKEGPDTASLMQRVRAAASAAFKPATA